MRATLRPFIWMWYKRRAPKEARNQDVPLHYLSGTLTREGERLRKGLNSTEHSIVSSCQSWGWKSRCCSPRQRRWSTNLASLMSSYQVCTELRTVWREGMKTVYFLKLHGLCVQYFVEKTYSRDVKTICIQILYIIIHIALMCSWVVMRVLCVCMCTGDARNDIYVTLEGGSFSKGTKTAERNVEVAVNVVDKSGTVIPVRTSLSLSPFPLCTGLKYESSSQSIFTFFSPHSESDSVRCRSDSVSRVYLLHLLP